MAEKSAAAPTPLRGVPAPHTTTLLGGSKASEEAAHKD